METRFAQASADASRSGTQVAIMFLDLDSFKTINDSLGHPVGDALLKGVAERLSNFVRASDFVSRHGGDEFLIMFTGLASVADVSLAAERLVQDFSAPFLIDGHEIATSFSVGIAICPQDGIDFATVLKRADIAMYQAKAAGRATYRLFSDQMDVAALGVESQEVVHSRNPDHRRLVIEGRVWPMPVVVIDEGLQRGLAQG